MCMHVACVCAVFIHDSTSFGLTFFHCLAESNSKIAERDGMILVEEESTQKNNNKTQMSIGLGLYYVYNVNVIQMAVWQIALYLTTEPKW